MSTQAAGADEVVLSHSNGATAVVKLHGAHVTSFKPNGEELIFMSEKAVFTENQAIRGGNNYAIVRHIKVMMLNVEQGFL